MQPVIQTYTGKLFNLLDPDPADICIEDIAHALSMICRFTGHCKRFYSVAEHSVYVARLVHPDYKLRALLHDAAEAYLGDVSSPLKHQATFTHYRDCERSIQQEVNEAYGLLLCGISEQYRVKISDRTMTGYEALHLLQGPLLDSNGWAPYTELARNEPMLQGFELQCLRPEDAENMFLNEFRRLTA